MLNKPDSLIIATTDPSGKPENGELVQLLSRFEASQGPSRSKTGPRWVIFYIL